MAEPIDHQQFAKLRSGVSLGPMSVNARRAFYMTRSRRMLRDDAYAEVVREQAAREEARTKSLQTNDGKTVRQRIRERIAKQP